LSANYEVLILSGAASSEREISLRSGRHAHGILASLFPSRLVELADDLLPVGLDARRTVIFPLIHGEFGEDGRLQALLDRDGFVYVGSGKDSMELTINKARTKERVAGGDIPTLPHFAFAATEKGKLSFEVVCETVGASELFLKPNDKGSSIQCYPCRDRGSWIGALDQVREGHWIVEPFCRGRNVTVALLQGRALPVLETLCGEGFLSYEAKYGVDAAEHLCPAPIGGELTARLRNYAERAFSLCACRDWARADFLLRSDGAIFFLEINGIPGFAETSFFPACALGAGISSAECLRKLIQPALERHRYRYP
jgi:D-alanine-D-alanine ligase